MLDQVMQQQQKGNSNDGKQKIQYDDGKLIEMFALSPLVDSSLPYSIFPSSPLSQFNQKNIHNNNCDNNNVNDNSNSNIMDNDGKRMQQVHKQQQKQKQQQIEEREIWKEKYMYQQQQQQQIQQDDDGDDDDDVVVVDNVDGDGDGINANNQLYQYSQPKQQIQQQQQHVPYNHHQRSPLTFSEMKLLIESNKIGAIIGVRGETIKKIRERSGASINVNERYGTNDRQVLISGLKEQIIEACSLIMMEIHLLSARFEKLVASASFQGSNINDDDSKLSMLHSPSTRSFEIRLLIVNSKIGALIGKSGSTIKQIRTSSSCQIRIAKDILIGSSLEERIVLINGTYNQVRVCLDLIMTKMSEASMIPINTGNHSFSSSSMDLSASDSLGVGFSPINTANVSSNSIWSSAAVSSSSLFSSSLPIIVPNVTSSLIDDDSDDNDVFKGTDYPPLMKSSLSFDEENDVSPKAENYNNGLSSSTTTTEKAHSHSPFSKPVGFQESASQIESLLTSISLSINKNNGSDNKHENRRKTQENLYVSEKHVGRIIGKGGATINEIRMRSGAEIKIQPRVGNSPTRVVTLLGNDESIRKAKQLIEWFLY